MELEISVYREGLVFAGGLRVTAIVNSHQAKLRTEMTRLGYPNKGECFSFKIEIGGKSLVYSADVGSFDDLRSHLEDIDYAIVETTHVDTEEIFGHARKSTVGAYILTHLGDHDEVALLRQRICESGLENLLIAEDGLRLEL